MCPICAQDVESHTGDQARGCLEALIEMLEEPATARDDPE